MAAEILPKLDRFTRVLPILGWLPSYHAGWFRADVIAGLTLWGILVPEGIAYAGLAGAPVQAGLYTLLGSLVAYAILGTSRQAVSAPTSGSSIMMAAVVAPFLVTDPGEFHSVMTGFVFGLAIYIAASQVPKLFGLSRAHGDTLFQLWHLVGELGAANWVTFAIGAGGLALLYIIEARAPRAPGPLMIMAAGILVASVLRLADQHGVQVVGVVHPGLPVLSPPKANLDDVLDLLPGAFAITLFILSEALGVGYSLSSKYGYDIDANQELIALGISNVAAACLGGLVSGCSVSSTAVNDRAGAKSQISSLAAATMILITLVALMPLFHYLPQAILSAIVIHAVARMMRVAELKRFYRFHPSEFGLALVALLGVITVGILPGLGIAVVLSLVRFIWGASHLSLSRLGPVPGKEHSYQVIGDASAWGAIPGLAILRLDGPLFFANALRFRNEVRQLLAGSASPSAIVINLHANFGIDLSATDTLTSLVAEAEKTNTELLFAELQDPVRQMFRRCGLVDRVGESRIFPTVDDAVQVYLRRHAAAHPGNIS